MEERERYKWSQDVIIECAYEDYDYIVDTENNIIFDDDNYFKLVDLLNQQDKENQQLKQQLTITEKALELACERVKYFEEMQDREMGHFEFFGYENEYDLQAIVKNYIDKAKELKSE